MLFKIIYTLFKPNRLLLSGRTKNMSQIFPTCFDAPISEFSLWMKISSHRRKLPSNTGGTKATKGVTNFNLRRSQFVKTGKNGLNQSLIYMHPFHPLSSQFFYLSLFICIKKIV